MNRQTALVLSLICFFVFTLLTYYGAKITLWSSIIFGLFTSLILLNIFYPVGQLANEQADFSLYVYAIYEIIGIILLALFILQKTMTDVRKNAYK